MSEIKLLVLLSAVFAVQAVEGATRWADCGGGKSAFSLKNADLAPAQIFPGNAARFAIDVTGATHDVDAGQIVMLVKLSGLPIYTTLDDLCAKTTCPISAGADAQIVYEVGFPEFTPPGAYSVTLMGHEGSAAGALLFCVTVNFQVLPPPSPPPATSQDGEGLFIMPRKALTA